MNAELHGHWYCSFCNDVVNLRKPSGRWDDKRGVRCPVCHNNSADWVPEKEKPATVSPERGAELFQQVKEAVK